MCYCQLDCGLVLGSVSVCVHAERAWASACVYLWLGHGVKTGSTDILYVPAAESFCSRGNEARCSSPAPFNSHVRTHKHTYTRIQTNMQLLWAAMMGERELSNMNLFHSCKQAVMSCVCSHTVWRLKNEINVNTLLWPTYAIQHYTRCCSWPRNQLTSISLQRTGGICLLQKNVEKAEKPIAFQNNQ